MKKGLTTTTLLIVLVFGALASGGEKEKLNTYILTKYEKVKGVSKPSYDLYNKGVVGYFNLLHQGKLGGKNLLTLIDFRLSSNKKRIWVIDMAKDSVIYHDLVSHGRNTGNEYAKKFSNVPNSNQSSLGFYVTGENYVGKHGLSLRLDGMERDFNSNARRRAVVMHGADYVDEAFTKAYGRIGRSFGCPAIRMEGHDQLLKRLADKTCLFIYYPDSNYLTNTKLQNPSVAAQYLDLLQKKAPEVLVGTQL